MAGLDRRSFALELARHVHQAAEVARENGVGRGFSDVLALARNDGVGEFAVFDGKEPTEAAAGLGLLELDETEALDAGEQTPRLRLDAELAQARAGIELGDRSVVARRHLFDAEHVDEETDEFVGFVGETLSLQRHIRFAREKLGIVRGEHAPAGTARHDDVVAVLERIDRLLRQIFGGRPVAGVVGRLAAARLARHDDLAAGLLQELDGGEPNRRADNVNEAGDEQSHAGPRDRRPAVAGRRGVHVLQDSLLLTGRALVAPGSAS